MKIYLQEPVGKFEKISPFLQKLDLISSKIDSVKKTLNRPVIPISNRAVVRFLTRELFYFRNKLEKIDRDISLTREFMLGRCLPTSQLENFLEHLSTGKVPPAWLVIDDSCTDAIELIENLYERAELLISYIRPKSRQPCYYDLGVFSHPKGFLGSVLEDFAGERKVDVEKLVWVVEVSLVILCLFFLTYLSLI